jgi:uncharacterized protein (TIGR00297 family)
MRLDFFSQMMIAAGAAAAVAAAAWRLGALRPSGAVAATFVGAAVLGCAGLGPALVLVFFFASSTALSALPGPKERASRGARQVAANGSVAAVAALLHPLGPLGDLAFLGAIAAATSDTWATEIGVRLGRAPRSLLTLRPRPPGASGAVSLPGTLAASAGALAVGTAGWLLAGTPPPHLPAVAAAGLIASLIDSALGDAFQAVYRCPACGASPQVSRHDGCTVRAARVSGIPGLDNDAVNWVATAVGAALAVALAPT